MRPEAPPLDASLFSSRWGRLALVAGACALSACHCGNQATLTATPSAVDFGTLPPGGTATKTVTLASTGTKPVAITSVSITGANASAFSVVQPAATTLDGGAQEALLITFQAATLGAFTAELDIASNAAPLAVPLTGAAVPCGGVCDQPPQCFTGGACVDGGCVYTAMAGAACNDGEPCTTNDTCTAEGLCVGTAQCSSPPPPVCLDGGTQRTYSANGSCSIGGCSYAAQDALCPAPGGCSSASGQCACAGLLKPCPAGCCSGVLVHTFACGGQHTCGLGRDGGLFCWGLDSDGQLGNGADSGQSASPVAVAGLAAPASVSAGGQQTCAITTSGALWCWGNDAEGELGAGSPATSSATPVAVSGLGAGVLAVSAGGNDTACALDASGGASCWGDNSQGQVGDGTMAQRRSPAGVLGLDAGLVAVVADGFHACALTAAGSVWCWGSQALGQLGSASDGGANSPSPASLSGFAGGVLQLAVGAQHACALIAGGTVQCWGDNSMGQLGAGLDGGSSASPQNVTGLSGAVALSAQGFDSCALDQNGAVWCWGDNTFGQLGTGSAGGAANAPAQIATLPTAVDVSVGAHHACALDTQGALWCWGDNTAGQLGLGDAGNPVASPAPVTAF